MADNIATRVILEELTRQGVHLDLLILQHADMRGQWRRVKRKLASGGLAATIARIKDAVLLSRQTAASAIPEAQYKPGTILRTTNLNSDECVRMIGKRKIDLLLSCTDTFLRSKLFSAPRIATLNAHPGWVPGYRGLGALIRQLDEGYKPAVSVHAIDHGVDTGPLLLRREFEFSALADSKTRDVAVHKIQAQCFAEVLNRFKRKVRPGVLTRSSSRAT